MRAAIKIYALGQDGYKPLSYALDDQPFQESGTFLNVESGEYLVRVKDIVGCEASLLVKVPDKSDAVILQDVEVDHGKCGEIRRYQAQNQVFQAVQPVGSGDNLHG